MPEVDGFGVVRLLNKRDMPMIAFVTAHDEHAIRAFELNAVDYILKPVEAARLCQTIDRAKERLEREDRRAEEIDRIRAAAADYDINEKEEPLQWIPIRRRDEIILVPVEQLVSVVAEGELIHLSTTTKETHTIFYRLKDLAARLDPRNFVRLGRGAVVNINMIRRIVPVAGGTYTVILSDDRELPVSRIQSRVLREKLLRL
jgi:two-component system LytT family response regulator